VRQVSRRQRQDDLDALIGLELDLREAAELMDRQRRAGRVGVPFQSPYNPAHTQSTSALVWEYLRLIGVADEESG
jgi:hypothetical protein